MTAPGSTVGPGAGVLAAWFSSVAPGVVQVRSDGRGSGAGFVWSPDGLVMTNDHVAGRGRVRVLLTDGRTFDAEVVKRDRGLDLAVLRVAAKDLTALDTGDSDLLRAGELVFAVGHPWGRVGAVTAGVVGGTGVMRGSNGRGFVQTDAYLAPGNSGGPLVDAAGRVVGINALVASGGLALAVPINVATAWAAGNTPRPEGRPYLGVRVRLTALDDRREGLLVVAVAEGSPAARAGLLVGDALLALDGEPLDYAAALPDALSRRTGSPVRLDVLRDGRRIQVEAEPATEAPARERGRGRSRGRRRERGA